MTHLLDRRQMLRGAAATGAGLAATSWMPAWAQPVSRGIAAPIPSASGSDIRLEIARRTAMIDGKPFHAIGINGTTPGPLIRLREGQDVRLDVTNHLETSSSIHWHGLLVPPQFDGVPGVSFPGIDAGTTFRYAFPIKQAGTYWYHSHSGGQEQSGLHGPIVIDPADPDPVAYDREHIIFLSDDSQLSPETIFRRMKVNSGGMNFQRQTLAGLLAGRDQPESERLKWGGMRMDPTDISDGTGAIYTYTINGYGPEDNWTALFKPGERVRLRVINGSSMTIFNVRIPGLPLVMVQADGQNIRPVETDEFQIGVAETFDAVVTPPDVHAYTLVAEAVDRSGMARATLAPRAGMVAPVPALRPRPLATMTDMGMDMQGMSGGMDMKAMPPRGPDPTAEQNASRLLATEPVKPPAPSKSATAMGGMAGMPMAAHGDMQGTSMAGHHMKGMNMSGQGGGMDMSGGMQMSSMSMRDFDNAPGVKKGAGVSTIAPMPKDRTGEPGQGLENVGHRVLAYTNLVALERNPDVRAPSRSLDIHLTGNMERFMWSFDGVKMSDAAHPIPFHDGERVRVRLINDTMMAHPIHLHGHFFELVTGHGDHAPRKHTVVVAPGGKVAFDLTADAPGDWAFHCHLLYHMMAGMMRVVSVRKTGDAA
ncbi:copper resistance system multicopper oxidase [Sphingomonas sp. H39-1-10]|uniref:copper resistance system multicopper oxidase n=1 Tax=Sphingomonas pollutisoli TaxID=3030829 RepID=UPI0023B97A87|nr:copper resistance system multicopper oxidase [Sphingomonas pollutisoli]MDF0491359.1 copper resistance system multicopper oxidase [Sphingomonas pollutisoli]